jgi:hypothetical protein
MTAAQIEAQTSTANQPTPSVEAKEKEQQAEQSFASNIKEQAKDLTEKFLPAVPLGIFGHDHFNPENFRNPAPSNAEECQEALTELGQHYNYQISPENARQTGYLLNTPDVDTSNYFNRTYYVQNPSMPYDPELQRNLTINAQSHARKNLNDLAKLCKDYDKVSVNIAQAKGAVTAGKPIPNDILYPEENASQQIEMPQWVQGAGKLDTRKNSLA